MNEGNESPEIPDEITPPEMTPEVPAYSGPDIPETPATPEVPEKLDLQTSPNNEPTYKNVQIMEPEKETPETKPAKKDKKETPTVPAGKESKDNTVLFIAIGALILGVLVYMFINHNKKAKELSDAKNNGDGYEPENYDMPSNSNYSPGDERQDFYNPR